VLQTPLFRVRNRRTKIRNKQVVTDEDVRQAEQGGQQKKSDFITRYCYSDEERLKAISDLGPDPEITRFKGLGEISPEEFAGFLGPDIRLEQVTLHKTDQVQKLLEYYMGKNTMERQNFIIDNLVIEEDRPEEDQYE
jgi:topoisomerase-4 subunit B